MMILRFSAMVWLCWMVMSGLRGVVAQDDDDDGGSDVVSEDGNANSPGGRRFGFGADRKGGSRFGHKNRPSFLNGGRFEKGRHGHEQGDDQDAADGQNNFPLPISPGSTPTESPEQPPTLADASPSSSAVIESVSSLFVAAPIPTVSASPTSPLPTAQATVTRLSTIYVTESPTTLPTTVPVEEVTASTQATPAPLLDLAPLPIKPPSVGEKAGIGIGITSAVLLLLSAIAYALFHHRKMKDRERPGSSLSSAGSPSASPHHSFAPTGFFAPDDPPGEPKFDTPPSEPIFDPQWSIESAFRVSMVHGSVKTVEPQTRPVSPLLPMQPAYLPRASDAHPGSRFETLGDMDVVKAGMKVPHRKPVMGFGSMALRSNPPVSSTNPIPRRTAKTGSWPLV